MISKSIIYLIIISLTLVVFDTIAQVRYSPSWFGPNANPVPEFGNATIPRKTTADIGSEYYFGYGDETRNLRLKFEIPLLPYCVSMKIWNTAFENYEVSEKISQDRDMYGSRKGRAFGDFYVQTRIRLMNETKKKPALVLNSTLKTASGTNFLQRRYFDTPGYYFDIEGGKSFFTKSKIFNEIRLVADAGFMCWETSGSRQNDAPMYGLKLITGNRKWNIENTFSGYTGWMKFNPNYGSDYGDSPLIASSKINFLTEYFDYYIQYQVGIHDYPLS